MNKHEILLENLNLSSVTEAFRWSYLQKLTKIKDAKSFLEHQKGTLIKKMGTFGTDPFFNIKNQIELTVIEELLFNLDLGILEIPMGDSSVEKTDAFIDKVKRNKISSKLLPKEEKCIEVFKQLYEVFDVHGVKLKFGGYNNDTQWWILTDSSKNKAGLYLTPALEWRIDSLNFGEELQGYFEGLDICELMDCNNIDYDV